MPDTTAPAPLIAQLPDDLLDPGGLPTLAGAARTLFDQACPGLAGQSLFLLEKRDDPAGLRVGAAHGVQALIEQARQGTVHPGALFDPGKVQLSTRSDSLAEADRYRGSSLEAIRTALARITPAAALAQFEIEQTAYWEVPEQLSRPHRRLAQQQRARKCLAEGGDLLVEAGLLTPEAGQLIADIVSHPRWQDRAIARGVYRLEVRTAGDGRVTGLPGWLILTERPAGHDPALGHVTERQALTGEAVVCRLGYLGFIERHASLASALTDLRRQLMGRGPLFATLLPSLAPDGQAALLGERECLGGALELRVTPIDDNPFEHLVQQQIDAWRENALHAGPSLWRERVGLDASPSKAQRQLQAFREQRQAARAVLWDGLRELPAARQKQLDTLFGQLQENQAVADRYFSTLPAFEGYACEKIRAELLQRGWDIDPALAEVAITVTHYRPDFEASELAPGVLPDDRHFQSSRQVCTLFEYIAMRLDQAAEADWSVELPDQPEVPLKVLGEVAEQLDLQDRYQQALTARLQRPADSDEAQVFEQSQQAAQALFEIRLRIDALLANSKGELDDSGYRLIGDLLARNNGKGALGRVEVMLLAGNSVRDVLFFSALNESSIVCYTPGHPSGRAFARFTSRSAWRVWLTAQLAGLEDTLERPGESARYWLERFGRHQLQQALPALLALARGKGGSLLSTAALVQPVGKAVFAQRTRYLLAEGDAQAVSDRELALERGLEQALTLFRLVSLVLPGRIMTLLDLAEIGFFLFNSYASYSAGQRYQAGVYLIETLASVSGLVNAKGPRLSARGPAGAPMRRQVSAGRLSIEPVQPAPPGEAAFRFESGERAGLEVARRHLYVELADGQRYPVHEVLDPLDGSIARYLGEASVSRGHGAIGNPAPRIVRDPQSGHWRVLPRLRLLGGGDSPRGGGDGAPELMHGVVSRKFGEMLDYYVYEGDVQRRVEFDLETCSWFCPEPERYLRYDQRLDRHVEQPRPSGPASPLARQRAREQFELPPYPALTELRSVVGDQPLPRQLHQVWLGTSRSLIEAHAATLEHNVRLAKDSGYRLEVHFHKVGGMLPEGLQLRALRRRFPDVVFSSLRSQAFFVAFKAAAVGRIFEHFLAPGTRNLAAACDALRYRLVRKLGGIYLDMDDRMLKALPELSLAPGQLAVGSVVESLALGFRGFNNSHFASLKDNPLLDALEREMVTRFQAAHWPAQRPRVGEDGFWAYMREIARVTGPRLLNEVYGNANPRAEAMRHAGPYVGELQRASVIPEPEVQQWVDQVSGEVTLLGEYFASGSAASWMTGRR